MQKHLKLDANTQYIYCHVSIYVDFYFTAVTKSITHTIIYTIIRVRSAFSLVAGCVLLKYTRTDDVN